MPVIPSMTLIEVKRILCRLKELSQIQEMVHQKSLGILARASQSWEIMSLSQAIQERVGQGRAVSRASPSLLI